jgi:cytochrome c1
MKKLFVIATAAILFVGVSSRAQAQGIVKSDTAKWAEKTFKYVGEKACKTCHKVEHESWLTLKHANAWAALKPEEQAKPECASCHMTGKTAADSMIVNVSCEACHGPGSEYKSMKNMKDPKLAAAAGLLPVTEATCLQCHNKNSPTFKGFTFAEAMKTGMHKIKPKTETK